VAVTVNADNFVRAETHRIFADLQRDAGGVGVFRHKREPASIDDQTVIRMNRDTLYSFAILDLAAPAWLSLGTAAGWGGLPTSEASYVGVDPALPLGEYELTFKDVPVDAFWSVSVYNSAGFYQPNTRNLYSVNSITRVPNSDSSITVRLMADVGEDAPPNCIVTPQGWNYLIWLHRPRAEFIDEIWTAPSLTPMSGSKGG
jgi:hypothetical protein